MKRSYILMLSSAILFLAVACIGMQQFVLADSSVVVSDQQAGMLFGGACETGNAFTVSGGCGVEYKRDQPALGCRYEDNVSSSGSAGSFETDGRKNCGVSECGDVTKTKACGT